jgi:hypothetical protein
LINYKRNEDILKELKTEPIPDILKYMLKECKETDFLNNYKINNRGRPKKRLLEY